MFLRSLFIALRTETIITAGPNSTSWPSSDELVNLSGLGIELSESSASPEELDGDLWKDVVVPEMIPSFTSCTLVQQHFLGIGGGFSFGIEGPVQVRHASHTCLVELISLLHR